MHKTSPGCVVLQDMRVRGELCGLYQIGAAMISLTLARDRDQWPAHDLFPMFGASDFNRDRVTDTRDVLAFLNAWAGADDRCDLTGDAVVNTLDMLKFLNLYAGGCA